MRVFAIICTREPEIKADLQGFCGKLKSCGINVKVLASQLSIFSAYQRGLAHCDAKDDDVIIFCHDDIQIRNPNADILALLTKCLEPTVGIVGPAGTAQLQDHGVWWDRTHTENLRGKVWHVGVQEAHQNGGRKALINNMYETVYGDYGPVVALDGLFLAARKEVWDLVGLGKPEYLEGLWDFYDIHYTVTSHLLGFTNYALPFDIVHASGGELAGRESWHKNREAFTTKYKKNFPITVRGESK
jgi:glycosyltransferase involved in cell wall biosynthesis